MLLAGERGVKRRERTLWDYCLADRSATRILPSGVSERVPTNAISSGRPIIKPEAF